MASGPRDKRWSVEEECHELVFERARIIRGKARRRRQQELYYISLYDDSEMASLVSGMSALDEFVPQTLSTNIVRRQVDTFVSRMAKNRPLPMALTTGGNFAQQRRAKALSKFGEGELDNVKFWPTRSLRHRDAAICGDGFALNYRVGAQRFHDRVFPWEVGVDPWTAQHGKPQDLFLWRYVDKLVLASRFPKFAEQIYAAQEKWDDEDLWAVTPDETCDLVLVIEAWRLPSGPNAGDGSHAICVSNATLEHSEYTRDYFPFSKFHYSPAVVGWRGEGMVSQLAGLQYEVNAIGLRLQEMGYLTGTHLWLPPGVGAETDTIDNGTWSIIRSAVAPQPFAPSPWPPGFLEYFQMLKGQMPGELTGQSALATRAEKPPGLDSGEAVRRYHSVDDENLAWIGKHDEQDAVDTFWQLLDLAEEIHDEHKAGKGEPVKVSIESRAYGKSVLDTISYADVRLDRDQFTLRVFPTNYLASTPEDRWAQVQDLIKGGFLSQDEALALLDFPDLQRVMNLRGAARRNIERLLEKILESDDPESDYEIPTAAWNLELCKALALTTWLDAKIDGAPEENLRWVLKFALDAQHELESANAGTTDAAAAAQTDAGAPIDQGAGAMAGPPPGAPPEQYAPPDQPPLPANAVAPETIAMNPPT